MAFADDLAGVLYPRVTPGVTSISSCMDLHMRKRNRSGSPWLQALRTTADVLFADRIDSNGGLAADQGVARSGFGSSVDKGGRAPCPSGRPVLAGVLSPAERDLESLRSARSVPGKMVLGMNGARQDSAWKMCVAIAASCVIHASGLVLPYFGTGADASSAATHSAGLPQGRLNVRLTGNQPAIRADTGLFAGVQNAAVVGAPTGGAAATDERPGALQRSGLGLLPIEGITYYASSQLTQRPVPLTEIALDDPAIVPVVASGKMVMTLWINAQGEVENAAVEESGLPSLFTGPAIAAFKRLRFRPGELNGRSVGTIMKIEVTYEDGRSLGKPPASVFAGDALANP